MNPALNGPYIVPHSSLMNSDSFHKVFNEICLISEHFFNESNARWKFTAPSVTVGRVKAACYKPIFRLVFNNLMPLEYIAVPNILRRILIIL